VRGTLALDGAVLKRSSASPGLLHHRGRAVVSRSYEEMRRRVEDPALDVDETSVLVLAGCGPVGGPGMPEWGMIHARMSGPSFGTVRAGWPRSCPSVVCMPPRSASTPRPFRSASRTSWEKNAEASARAARQPGRDFSVPTCPSSSAWTAASRSALRAGSGVSAARGLRWSWPASSRRIGLSVAARSDSRALS
jgi:hypothetical protein